MKRTSLLTVGIVIISFAFGIYLYPHFPEQLASHWNAAGETDGYMSKFWGLFLMPIILLLTYLLFLAIPRIDPLKKNIEKFRRYYDEFILLTVGFMFYVYNLTLWWNLGVRFDFAQFLTPAIALLFIYTGTLMGHSKRNWFIGIRTPWTLSSDMVWNKTHALGGKLFKLAGILSLAGLVFRSYAIHLIVVPIILFSVYLIIYSYLEYRKVSSKKIKG